MHLNTFLLTLVKEELITILIFVNEMVLAYNSERSSFSLYFLFIFIPSILIGSVHIRVSCSKVLERVRCPAVLMICMITAFYIIYTVELQWLEHLWDHEN